MQFRRSNSDNVILYDRATPVGGITIRIKYYDGQVYLRDRNWHQRKIVECGIGRTDEPGKLVSSWTGAAICFPGDKKRPGDKFNTSTGMDIAFKRCLRSIKDKKLRHDIREFYFWGKHVKNLIFVGSPIPERLPVLFGDRRRDPVTIPTDSTAESLAVATGAASPEHSPVSQDDVPTSTSGEEDIPF